MNPTLTGKTFYPVEKTSTGPWKRSALASTPVQELIRNIALVI